MNSIFLQLLALASIAIAMPAIDNGMGEQLYGPERVVTEFAVLSDSNLDDLPDDITLCSSVTTGGAWTGPISPFQLLHENGEPWVSLVFLADTKKTTHQIWLHVSSILAISPFVKQYLSCNDVLNLEVGGITLCHKETYRLSYVLNGMSHQGKVTPRLFTYLVIL